MKKLIAMIAGLFQRTKTVWVVDSYDYRKLRPTIKRYRKNAPRSFRDRLFGVKIRVLETRPS